MPPPRLEIRGLHRHGPIHHWLEDAARSFQQYLLWGWVEQTLKARAWRERDRGEGCESRKDAEEWRYPHSEEGWRALREHQPCLPQAPHSGDMLEGRHSSSPLAPGVLILPAWIERLPCASPRGSKDTAHGLCPLVPSPWHVTLWYFTGRKGASYEEFAIHHKILKCEDHFLFKNRLQYINSK